MTRGKTDAVDAEAAGGPVRSQVKGRPGPAADADRKHDPAQLGKSGVVVAKGIHNVDRLLDTAGDMPDAARADRRDAGR